MPPSALRHSFLFAFAILSTVSAIGQDASVIVGAGGVGRVLRGKWGLVQGTFANSSDSSQEILAVVIPADSHGLQYSRYVNLPANSRRTCQWPVMIPDQKSKSFDFEYLVFEDSDGSGPIQRLQNEQVSRSFSMVNPESRQQYEVGYRGLLMSGKEDPQELRKADTLADAFRAEAQNGPMTLSFQAEDLSGYPESLECLDQLMVTSRTLHQFPEACDAVKIWTQRGGRVWLCLDQTGIATVQALLGDTMPISKIDETSSNVMTMDLSPDASPILYPERHVVREFAEPARLVRVIADGGKVHWSIDGWPAVIEVPFGRGTVFVTTVSLEVFADLEGKPKVTLCAKQIIDRIFSVSENHSPIGDQELISAAAAFIGYEIPSRFFAAVLMLGFVAAVAVVGVVLVRKQSSESLLWVVPGLALACALPAVWLGSRSRSVAPPTAIQQQVSAIVTGQSILPADGIASVFYPESQRLDVHMDDFSLVIPADVSSDSFPRRMVWTDLGQSHWQNLQQSAGIRNYRVRSLKRLQQPGRVTATINEHGFVGRFESSESNQSSDMILAGTSTERMAVRANGDDGFQATSGDVLAPSEFVTGTLLTDSQKQRSAVYEDLFTTNALDTAFPQRLTLFSWIDSNQTSLRIGDESTRQAGSTLLMQEVTLQAPPVGAELLIPPALLPFRAVMDEHGGLSGAYSNSSRKWLGREKSLVTLLKFEVPDVCQPFEATGGTLTIRLNAGSRPVSISAGAFDSPLLLQKLDSPAGKYEFVLNVEHLSSIKTTGVVYVRIDVGKTISADAAEESSERDDGWKIERLMMSLNGVRGEKKFVR